MDELGFGKQVNNNNNNNNNKDYVPKLKHDDNPSVNHMDEMGLWKQMFFTCAHPMDRHPFFFKQRNQSDKY